jgi:hypothetical protein
MVSSKNFSAACTDFAKSGGYNNKMWTGRTFERQKKLFNVVALDDIII